MIVDVTLHATLRIDRFHQKQIRLPEGSRVSNLLVLLKIPKEDVGILMINLKDGTFDQVLCTGDRVTIIPPLGGG